MVIDISEGHTYSQSSSPSSPLHLGFLGALVTWFGEQAVGSMSSEMVDWIPSRGKRFVSSPDYPDQLWGSPASYSACSMDSSPSGKVAGA